MKKTLFVIVAGVCSFMAAQASIFDYSVTLSGPAEAPPNLSPGSGTGTVEYNDALHTLKLNLTFSGLLGPTTASHLHAATTSPLTGTAGVATSTPYFAGFPIGVTAGTYSNTLDLTAASSYNSSFVTANGGTTAGAEAALASAMAGGEAYWNVHTTSFPGGEIRGFLVPVPEPGTLALAALGAAGLALGAWRGRRP
jgi:hypothetical protein